ncbi:MAG: 30S ribosomal protein S6 [Rickettsiaceae bacterium]|jgi:small subunit ribosomal protein S6|nr:30S ribosomal protein S6 [Rickettsiaceae bacterium]MCP5378241.1 30S ribosomal protein S6 [Rickettsiaceae bacterium]WPX98918.1 30S ribosomal protein S6 [Candidatus Megaera polyxenophila]
MAFYESIIVIRQDVSSSDVDKIADDFMKIIKEHNGNVLKTEYWGLRTLAYEIKNNKKGHYYFMGIEADNALVKELGRKIKLSESVIRSSLVKVKKISQEPSPILRTKSLDLEETVDVTINQQ